MTSVTISSLPFLPTQSEAERADADFPALAARLSTKRAQGLMLTGVPFKVS